MLHRFRWLPIALIALLPATFAAQDTPTPTPAPIPYQVLAPIPPQPQPYALDTLTGLIQRGATAPNAAGVNALAVHPNGQFAVADGVGLVRLYTLMGDAPLILTADAPVIQLAFAPTQGFLIGLDANGRFYVWRSADGGIFPVANALGEGLTNNVGITGFALSADETTLYVSDVSGQVRVWQFGGIPTPTPPPSPTLDPNASVGPTPLPAGFPPLVDAEVQVAEQVFEGGRMFWVQPVNQLWVMLVEEEGRGRWLVYADTFDEAVDFDEDPNITPPEGKIEPERGFGKLWRENPEVRDALGWALTPEFGYISQYRYVPGGQVTNGVYTAGPGYHILFSLNSELFRFNESDGTWQLGE
ncbi:MAG: hypothetical protein ACOYL5_06880 [Phototrophicaceae bacterium]